MSDHLPAPETKLVGVYCPYGCVDWLVVECETQDGLVDVPDDLNLTCRSCKKDEDS